MKSNCSIAEHIIIIIIILKTPDEKKIIYIFFGVIQGI